MKGYTCVAKVPIYSAGRHFDCEFKWITSSNDATQYSTQRIPKHTSRIKEKTIIIKK